LAAELVAAWKESDLTNLTAMVAHYYLISEVLEVFGFGLLEPPTISFVIIAKSAAFIVASEPAEIATSYDLENYHHHLSNLLCLQLVHQNFCLLTFSPGQALPFDSEVRLYYNSFTCFFCCSCWVVL